MTGVLLRSLKTSVSRMIASGFPVMKVRGIQCLVQLLTRRGSPCNTDNYAASRSHSRKHSYFRVEWRLAI